MYYEINVSKDGKHVFATADRSITCRTQAEEMTNLFNEKFPKSEGYKVDVTLWRLTGEKIV